MLLDLHFSSPLALVDRVLDTDEIQTARSPDRRTVAW
jgi:hypothetical protein